MSQHLPLKPEQINRRGALEDRRDRLSGHPQEERHGVARQRVQHTRLARPGAPMEPAHIPGLVHGAPNDRRGYEVTPSERLAELGDVSTHQPRCLSDRREPFLRTGPTVEALRLAKELTKPETGLFDERRRSLP